MERITIQTGPTPRHVSAAFKRSDGSLDTSVTDVRWGIGSADGPPSDGAVQISPNAGLEVDVYANAPSPLGPDSQPIPTIIEVSGDADERDGSTKIVRAAFEVVAEDANRDADHVELTFS